MNTQWWVASIVGLSVNIIGRYVFYAPYKLYSDKKSEFERLGVKLNESDKNMRDKSDAVIAYERELNELRRQQRHLEETKAYDIPNTLSSMNELVIKVMNLNKNKPYDNEKYIEAFAEVFEVNKDSQFFQEKYYSSPDRIKRTTDKLAKYLGIKKNDTKGAFKFGESLCNSLEKRELGLCLSRNEDFQKLKAQLEQQTKFLSDTILGVLIERYVDSIQILYNLKMLIIQTEAEKNIMKFPKNLREAIKILRDDTERVFRSCMAQINRMLEKHITGEETK